MAAPVWLTPAGDLGKIQEAEFYDFQLACRDPDVDVPGSVNPGITFYLQSGTLPSGLRLTRDGRCEGFPSCETFVAGVPTNVGKDVTSRFVVRAVSSDNIVDDRTFELTVVGQDDPIILTDGGLLGTYRDGDYVSHQISAIDYDPDDELTFSILSGDVPDGVSISSDGLLSGYIEPVPVIGGTPGFDNDDNGFDMFGFDFRTRSVNKNYEFTVVVTDGKSTVAETYSLFVYAGDTFTADTDILTADMSGYPLTADMTALRIPVLLTQPSDIGIVTHDNYFAFQFEGKDFDGDPIEYSFGVGDSEGFDNDSGFDSEINGFDQGDLELPPGLTIDPDTGWLYGYIPNQAATQTDYTFAVRVLKKNNNDYKSDWVFFTMTIVGDIRKIISWVTDADMGSIRVGEISTLSVKANNTLGKNLSYRFKPGSASRIPQGLRLSADGLIVGRPSFKTFMFDGGTTTFDGNSLIINETTFERIFTFTVEAYDADGDISAFRTFTITIDPGKFVPHENLWFKAYPKVSQREIWESLIQSPDDFPNEAIYRKTDYWYGIQSDIRFIATTGLNPSTATEMIATMAKNHYNKRVALGPLKKARAVRNGVVQYEVVYAEIIDREENTQRKSTSISIDFYNNHNNQWANPVLVNDTNGFTGDSDAISAGDTDQHVFYPNSFKNMNQRFLNEIGQLELESLPLWMRSKQDDGTILGFTPAVVVAYVNPGYADRIIFNINRRTDIDLKKIEFIVDRYIWDHDMSVNYDKDNDEWNETSETTFDLDDGIDEQTLFDGDGTRFLANSFLYKDEKDDGDTFLKFPQETIER